LLEQVDLRGARGTVQARRDSRRPIQLRDRGEGELLCRGGGLCFLGLGKRGPRRGDPSIDLLDWRGHQARRGECGSERIEEVARETAAAEHSGEEKHGSHCERRDGEPSDGRARRARRGSGHEQRPLTGRFGRILGERRPEAIGDVDEISDLGIRVAGRSQRVVEPSFLV
jgi:hypothetical protein